MGWIPYRTLREYVSKGPVLDCEMLPNGTLILIDILVDQDGATTARNKSLDEMLAYHSLLEEAGYLPHGLIVRSYLDSYGEALDYCDTVRYPTDGVVALTTEGMYTSKLKVQRSLEVQVRDKQLRSSDGVVIGTLDPPGNYDDGTILELRLGAKLPQGGVSLDEVLIRADKVVPNTSDVCRSILAMSTGTAGGDPVILRAVTDQCFVARSCIYEAAYTLPGIELIVDVGSGRGQSIGIITSMLRNAKATGRTLLVLLIDPKLTQSSIPRLEGSFAHHYHHSIPETLRSVRALVGASTSIVGVTCTLGQMLASRGFGELMAAYRICFTCAFSCSYVSDQISALVRGSHNVIGCCYMYDAVDDDGTLINTDGILMRLDPDDGNRALVQWPERGRSFANYEEPAVTRACFSPSVTVPFLRYHNQVATRVEKVLWHLYYVFNRTSKRYLLSAIAESA